MRILKGVDVSQWQGLINWIILRRMVDFVIIRAGSSRYGSPFTDTYYWRNAPEAILIPSGAYWYLKPSQDPAHQARYFYSLISGFNWIIPPVVDVEETEGLTRIQMRSAIFEFLDTLEGLINRKPMIYTGPYFWNNNVANSPRWQDYGLWIADWRAGPPEIPRGFSTWTIHQYGLGTGAPYGVKSSQIDLDYWGVPDEHKTFLPLVRN